MSRRPGISSTRTLNDFLNGKSECSIALFQHFVREFKKIGSVDVLPAKTMVGIATPRKRIVYVVQFGKEFIDAVFPFKQPYPDNLCFQKIAQVPGVRSFNHYLRMYLDDDVNDEVRAFMKLAYLEGK